MTGKTRRGQYSYEVIRDLLTIDRQCDTVKKLQVVSWTDNPPVYDLRNWIERDGQTIAGKGITLTPSQAKAVIEALLTDMAAQ